MNRSARPGRRVVITGLGLITPLGNSPQALWDALSAGRSGVAPLAAFPGGALNVAFAAEAREFTGDIGDFGALEPEQKKAIRKGLKLMCRECQMGVAAAQRALADARLAAANLNPDRSGVVFGSDYMVSTYHEFQAPAAACLNNGSGFEFSRWVAEGMSRMNPLWLLKYLPNMPASHIAIYNDLRGANNSLTLREASSNLAVGEAFRVIARGHADVMIAGATGTRIHPMKAVHAALNEELAAQEATPGEAARPFDLERTGMVLGEGAGAVILEELEHAVTRGAAIYAEVVGSASSSVADTNLVARRDAALANAMRGALRDAALAASEVGHLHAHALGTRTCDVDESRAIREVFGSLADRLPVVAAKSYFGNLGAASGMVELAASVLALDRNRLFPVLNYRTPDPQCAIAIVTEAGADPGASFLNLNVTPQGQASCLAVCRYEA